MSEPEPRLVLPGDPPGEKEPRRAPFGRTMPGTLTSSKAPSINRAHRLPKSGASSTGGGQVPPAMTAWTSLIVLGHVLKFSKPFAVMQTTCVEINQCVLGDDAPRNRHRHAIEQASRR